MKFQVSLVILAVAFMVDISSAVQGMKYFAPFVIDLKQTIK